MIFENLEGETLLETINDLREKDQELQIEEIGVIIYQLASLAAFLHRKNYIHRDIKPENINFTKESDYGNLLRFRYWRH